MRLSRLVELASSGAGREAVAAAAASGTPGVGGGAVVVELDDCDANPALVATLPLVVVGIGEVPGTPPAGAGTPAGVIPPGTAPGVELVDVLVPDEAHADQVVEAAAANPRASAALALLLRAAARRSVADGLVAESTTYSTLQAGPEHRKWLGERGPARERPDDGTRVTVRRDGDILHVTLARPDVRNAYDAAMREALLDALAAAQADTRLRVVIDGEGPVFCAGGDLDEFGTLADPASAHLVRVGRSVGWVLHQLAPRTTVDVHGSCVGSGVELAAFAGRVLAAPGTTFRLPEVAMGLVPGAGGTVSISQRIGRHRTAWLALTGAPIDAATARAWRLVDDVIHTE
jgi:enoyl-CoA hydratase/carnithine racemase